MRYACIATDLSFNSSQTKPGRVGGSCKQWAHDARGGIKEDDNDEFLMYLAKRLSIGMV